MKKFNVIIWDVNLKVFKYYNVIPYLTDCYNKEKNKPVNVEDLKILSRGIAGIDGGLGMNTK